MNNGITIIAKTLRATGNRVLIEDYQIVNGCQTSHVLFSQKELLNDDSVVLPLRVIATQDEAIIGSIIKATNRQTEVREDPTLSTIGLPEENRSILFSVSRISQALLRAPLASIQQCDRNRKDKNRHAREPYTSVCGNVAWRTPQDDEELRFATRPSWEKYIR